MKPFHLSWKVIPLANPRDPLNVWVRLRSWAKSEQTSGFVPEAIARSFGTKQAITKLVEAELFAVVDGGYQVQWSDQDLATSQARQAAGKRGALARWGDGKRMANASEPPPGPHEKPAETSENSANQATGAPRAVSEEKKSRDHDHDLSESGEQTESCRGTEAPPAPLHPEAVPIAKAIAACPELMAAGISPEKTAAHWYGAAVTRGFPPGHDLGLAAALGCEALAGKLLVEEIKHGSRANFARTVFVGLLRRDALEKARTGGQRPPPRPRGEPPPQRPEGGRRARGPDQPTYQPVDDGFAARELQRSRELDERAKRAGNG